MKTLITLLLPLLLSAPASFAQDTTAGTDTVVLDIGTAQVDKLALAMKNYRMGLESENEGLVESSLYYAVCLRLKFPEMDLHELERSIDHLVSRGTTQAIRYKAYLASTVYASPGLVDASLLPRGENVPGFFAGIGNQLQTRLLVHNE